MADPLSIIALVVSLGTAGFAAFADRRVSNRAVSSAVISDFYESLQSLTTLQLEEWQLSHLLEVAANYETVREELVRIAPSADDPAAVALRLKERAAAIRIFGLYEHVIYQLGEAKTAGDKDRTEFLVGAADYFRDRLLPNPRLRYLWAESGGNLACEFEDDVRAHYARRIPHDEQSWDATGPYG